MSGTLKKFLSVMLLFILTVVFLFEKPTSSTVEEIPLKGLNELQVYSVYTPSDLDCMTRAIYYEAGNQSDLGKEAVAKVILNRMKHGAFANTVCGVITQSRIINQQRICQFSFHCENTRAPDQNLWAQSKNIAEKALQNNFHPDIMNVLNDALYFHAWYVNPNWAKKMKKLMIIEDHIFYGEKNERKAN